MDRTRQPAAGNPGATPGPDPHWWQRPPMAAALGLGPLLAASGSLPAGLALGVASLAVLCASVVLVSAAARWLGPRTRLAAAILAVTACVTATDLLFRAYGPGLHGEVGLFVPLIATNALLVTQIEAAAGARATGHVLLDGLRYGLGFTLLLATVGGLRELLSGALVIATLPAGALFLLTGIVALARYWRERRAAG